MSASPSSCAADTSWVRRGTREYRRISVALFLAGFVTFSLLYCVQPLLPEFTTTFGVRPATSALALSLSTGSLAVAVLLAGAVSERLGRRQLMFLSMALAAVCNLVAAYLPHWPGLLAARALEGILLGGVPAVAMAYLSEEIDARDLGYAMGLYVGGTALGGLLGRVGIGVLTDVLAWREAMAIMSAVDLLAAFGFVALLPPSRHFVRKVGVGMAYHGQAWLGHLRHPALVRLFLVAFGLMGTFVSLFNYAGFRLMAAPYGLSQLQISHIFYAYLLGMVASPWAGALADRIGRGPVLLGGVVAMALGVMCTVQGSLPLIVTGMVLMTAGFFVGHAVASGWVGRLARQAKGHASSLYLWAYYMGSSVMGAVSGWFWEHGGWTGMALWVLGILSVVAVLAWQVRRMEAHGAAATAQV